MAISDDLEETHRIAINVLQYHPLEVRGEPSFSPLDVSILVLSPRPETTIPFSLTPIEPSISLDLLVPPHVTSILTFSPPPPPQPSISLDAPLPVIESIAPPPFLKETSHDIRLHVYVEFYLHQFHHSL
ncbi:hypothetical protein AAG906_032888 [Vitis piasezkii]